jgi:cation-transporting P-type ATPase 13A2
VGWSGPYPVLSKKRPTANLVSRKVLTPLLGQILLCICVQAAAFFIVREQEWYVTSSTYILGVLKPAKFHFVSRFIPPYIDPEKPNIKNSENTALFLVSCFEYIFIGIVLNAGRPFRQPMTQNCQYCSTPTFLSFTRNYYRFILRGANQALKCNRT